MVFETFLVDFVRLRFVLGKGSIRLSKSKLDELSHLSLWKQPVLVVIKTLKKFLEFRFIIIVCTILIDCSSNFLNELFGFNFVQVTILVPIILVPDLIKVFWERCFVIFKVSSQWSLLFQEFFFLSFSFLRKHDLFSSKEFLPKLSILWVIWLDHIRWYGLRRDSLLLASTHWWILNDFTWSCLLWRVLDLNFLDWLVFLLWGVSGLWRRLRYFIKLFHNHFSLVSETAWLSILEIFLCFVWERVDLMLGPAFEFDLQLIVDETDKHSLVERDKARWNSPFNLIIALHEHEGTVWWHLGLTFLSDSPSFLLVIGNCAVICWNCLQFQLDLSLSRSTNWLL